MKRTIWSNYDLRLEDFEDAFKDEEEYLGEKLTEDRKYELMDSWNDMYLDDERYNLNIDLPEDIIIIADIGTWRGRFDGYKEIKGNVADCLYSECDYVTWYCDRYNFKATCIHHDGTNYLLYRTWKEDVSETQKENFKNAILERKLTPQMISRYTKSLRPYIAEVYGW